MNDDTDWIVCSSIVYSNCFFRLQNLKRRSCLSGCTRKYHDWGRENNKEQGQKQNEKHHKWNIREAPQVEYTRSTTSGIYEKHHKWNIREAPQVEYTRSTTSGIYEKHHKWNIREAPQVEYTRSTTSGIYEKHH